MNEFIQYIWVGIGITIFGINFLIMIIRAVYHSAYRKVVHAKFLDLSKKIPYYDSDSRSKMTPKVLKRFFTFEVFSIKKSREYFNEIFGFSYIKKTKDIDFINKLKNTVKWWIISDFCKGIFFAYMILSIPIGIIFS